MDIEQFYEADERRRQSAEIELGTEWTDKWDVHFELNWVEDTGEVYVMCEPPPQHEWEDPFGGIHLPDPEKAEPTSGLRVSVIGHVADHDELERVFDGWAAAMVKPDSTAWIIERLRQASDATGEPVEDADPPAPFPE